MRSKFLPTCALTWTALILSFTLWSLALPAFAQVRVEAETYLPNPASGPNQTDITVIGTNGIVSTYVSWDWLEYDVEIPQDGLYTVRMRYGAGWGSWFQNPTPSPAIPAEPIDAIFTFYTAGQRLFPENVLRTLNASNNPDWNAYTELTLKTSGSDAQVPLKAGVNRIRVQIRPDNAINNRFGSGMNWDWFELTRVGDYPAMKVITGTVVLNAEGGTTVPAANAVVSVGSTPSPDARYITRADASGNYTLNVPDQSIPEGIVLRAFYNGYAPQEATVAAASTQQDFALTWNGRVEAELFKHTNPGPGDGAGLQSAYASDRSEHGVLWISRANANNPPKFAFYEITAPEAGVYEMSMNYTSWKVDSAIGYGRYIVSVNGGLSNELRFETTMTDANSAEVYQDSPKVLVRLEKGMNTVLLFYPDAASLAEVDYLTFTPATVPSGTLVVEVTNTEGGGPIPGATVTITNGDTTINGLGYSGATDANGRVEIPVPPGNYTATATTPTASTTGTANGAVAANQTTTLSIPLTLTALAVEAENNVAQGPGTPSVVILNTTSASGSQAITGFQANDRPEWVEWVIEAPQSGLYEVTLRYSRVLSPGEHTLNVWSTTYQTHVENLPSSGPAGAFASFTYTEPVPLMAGPNRFRITLAPIFGGTVNLDYIKFARVGNLPELVTITGTVQGTDGINTAPVAGALVKTSSPFGFEGETAALADFSGQYTLYVTPGAYSLTASANGYNEGNANANAPGTANITMPTNLSGALQIEPELAPVISQNLKVSGDEITNTNNTAFIELPISVPQAGVYQIALLYSSGWTPTDGLPVKTRWTVNGADYLIEFPTTTAWTDYTPAPVTVGSIPLDAGPNLVRMSITAKGVNIKHMVLTRTGPLPNPDISGNGTTDIEDAVLYARRLAGLDAGATPDLDSNGASDLQDVKRILNVAGGVQKQ